MAVPVAALAKIAAAALSDEDTRRKLGWIVAAICSPLILTLALICSLLSGSAEHNNSAVLLCFHGGDIPGKTPAKYVAYIEDMRRSFTLLDSATDAVNDMTENSDSLDGIRVKAVFYAIFFGEDTPSRRAHRQFVDCFVTYEERTRTVTGEDGTETEESYTVAIPVADIAAVYGNLENVLHLQLSEEQKSNADSVYNLVRYGIAGGSEGWIPGADVPYIANIDIDKKEKVKVHQITIVGYEALATKKLKRVMKKTNEKNKLVNLFRTKKFIEENYEAGFISGGSANKKGCIPLGISLLDCGPAWA